MITKRSLVDFLFAVIFVLSCFLFFIPIFKSIIYIDLLKYVFCLNTLYGLALFALSAIDLTINLVFKIKLLINTVNTLRLWIIWLCIFTLCSLVGVFCVITISNKNNVAKDTSILIDGELRKGQWHCITCDTHLPNNAISSMIDYKYDDNGDLESEIKYFNNGGIEYVLDYYYDQSGRIIEKKARQQYGGGHLNTTYSYDDKGRCIFEFNKDNANYNLEYRYDVNGMINGIVCRWGESLQYYQVNKYRYDRKLKKEIVYVDGNKKPSITSYYYDHKGNLIRKEYNKREVTNYFYDEYNNLIREDFYFEGNFSHYTELTYEFFIKQK